MIYWYPIGNRKWGASDVPKNAGDNFDPLAIVERLPDGRHQWQLAANFGYGSQGVEPSADLAMSEATHLMGWRQHKRASK
jgi:hypothetical protein